MLHIQMWWRILRTRRLAAAVMTLVVAVAAAITTAADFEAVMATIQMMTNAPADEMALLYGLARRLSKERKIPADEAARWIAAELAAGQTTWSLLRQSVGRWGR
jgi:hypothetical protein